MKKITRRGIVKAALYGGAGLVVGGLGYHLINAFTGKDYDHSRREKVLESIAESDNPEELPNIVIILTDDLGYGDLSCYGSSAVSTPNLDKMASSGVRMTSFYASAPVCTPSRAGLLTGRYPIRSHMNDALLTTWSLMGIGHRLLGYCDYGIPEDEILLSEMLKRRGYKTALIGKWHLGDYAPHLPNDRGFDFFYGAQRSNDIKPFAIYRNREIEVPAPADQEVLTTHYTKEAIDFIDQNRKNPFFLYFAHTFPHIPLHASDRFRGKSKGGLYGDTVEEIDWSVGELLKALKRFGLDRKTVVFFTSDNGPWYQGSPGGIRGRKRFVFEGGFRVPMIARWPGVIPGGTFSDEMSMNFDLFATSLQLAGVEVPSDRIIDGRNILPLLQGKAPSPHETLYFYWRKKLWAVRHRNWKYHRRHEVGDINPYPWPHNERRGPYLFNLETDPNESYSMTDTYPEVARQLATMMDEWESAVKRNIRGWE